MTANYLPNRNCLLKIEEIKFTGLSASVFTVDIPSRSIVGKKTFYQNCSAKPKVEILTTSSVLEDLTGEFIPVILARITKQNSSSKQSPCIYLFSVDENSESFVPLRKIVCHENFLIDAQDDSFSKSLMIIDGPGLVTFFSDEIFLFLPSDDLQFTLLPNCFSVKECFQKPDLSIRCRSCSHLDRLIFLQVAVEKGRYLLFFIGVFHCKQHSNKITKELAVIKFYEKSFSTLNRSVYIPAEYDDVISCVKYVDDETNNHVMFVGTSEGYVLLIEGGCLKRCVSITGTESCTIMSILVPVTVGTYSKDILVVQERQVVRLDNVFKVCQKWESVCNVLEGTFTSSGAWEFFLSFGDDISTAPWLITDLGKLCISSDQSCTAIAEEPASDSRSNTQVAVQALHARFQREEILLNEERQRYKQKAMFLDKCIEGQLGLLNSSSHYHPCHQPELVSLISSADVKFDQSANSHKQPAESVEICAVWQRTYNSSWLIGVDLHNKTGRDIIRWLQISPVFDSSSQLTVTSTCRSPVCKSQSSTAADNNHGFQVLTPKRMKYSDSEDLFSPGSPHSMSMVPAIEEVHTVTCVTSMPIFGVSGAIDVCVLLSWKYTTDSAGETNHEILSDEKRERTDDNSSTITPDGLFTHEPREIISSQVHTLYCGNIKLQSSDVIQGKYELQFVPDEPTDHIDMMDITDLKRNNLAWKHIQTVTPLDCRSTADIVATLEQLLIDRCQFCYSHTYSCYVTQVPALRHVQICVGPLTSDTVRSMDVYTSCEEDLFLLLHHLYAGLPDHLILVPQQTAPSRTLQTCLPSLQREHHFLSHRVRKLLKDVDAKRRSVSDKSLKELEDEEDVRKIGEKFKSRRENLATGSSEVADSEDIQTLSEEMRQLRTDTDAAIVQSGLL